MTTPNTPNAAERPSDRAIAQAYYEACALGAENYLPSIEARAREIDSHHPAESVSAEPVADRPEVECRYFFFPNPNVEGHQIELEWGFEYEAKGVHEKYFHPLHESDYLHPQPSTPGAVSDEWSPTIDDMPEGICVAKRIHVERSRHMDNWFVGFGKDESCQIEGTANHWYWLAYALLGLVDEKDSPYSEDKPLPFSPAYIRAALESFAKRSAEASGRDAAHCENCGATDGEGCGACPPAQAVSVGVPESVRYAVERMSIDPTWLKGVTAQEDARCMLIIADFISSLSAAPAAATREGKE